MPNRLRSRLLALALAACALTCAISLSTAVGATRGADARPHLRPFHVSIGTWRVPKRLRHKKQRKKRTLGERVARIALRAVGVPYRWGGTSPSGGFDCSGLVYWAYRHVGVALPHSSYALAGAGRRVRTSRLRPGDLLFFWGYGHVGLYVGHGRMIHAPHAGERVQVVRLARSGYGSALVAARRVR
ncbi:MAG TPA: C40 family peptidase [Gaiellaceae bacterium]|nr:C40 family peptidase [Gaiellaceae bacterium]